MRPEDFVPKTPAVFVGVDFGGVTHYRLMLPARELKASLFVRTGDLNKMKLVGDDQAPVAVYSMPRSVEMIEECEQLLAHPDRALIIDLDDCLRAVIEAGTHPACEQWAELLPRHEWLISRADLVTVTTPFLAEYATSLGAERVRIIPNAIDLERWNIKREPRHKTKTIVGWSGSYGHEEALFAAAPSLLQVLKDNDDVAFASVGIPLSQFFPQAWRHRIHDTAFVPMTKHPYVLTQFHYNIAPTLQTDFYRAKSDLRLLEAFASDSTFIGGEVTYGDTMMDARAGWMASSEDPDSIGRTLQLALGERKGDISRDRKAALEWLREERTIQAIAPLWRDAINEVLP